MTEDRRTATGLIAVAATIWTVSGGLPVGLGSTATTLISALPWVVGFFWIMYGGSADPEPEGDDAPEDPRPVGEREGETNDPSQDHVDVNEGMVAPEARDGLDPEVES